MVKNHKIAFYLYAITGAGQPKVMLDIAKGLALKGYDVVFFYSRIDNPVYYNGCRDLIAFKCVEAKSRFGAILSLSKLIKSEKIGVLFGAGNDNNCSVILARLLGFYDCKLIITEHNSISSVVANSKRKIIFLLPYFVRALYKFSDALVCVSSGIQKELQEELKIKHKRSLVIYNPVVDDFLLKASLEDIAHPWLQGDNFVFLGAGRISSQKDFFNLVKAFSFLEQNSYFKLIILGDGEDKEKLKTYIEELGVSSNVDLVGRVNNPYAYMKKSDVFVLSSQFEGLPTVLIEALACDMSIVSTDCPHGPMEILQNGKWGSLVPVADSKALAKAMVEAFEKPKVKTFERSKSFTHEESIKKYIELIGSLN